MGFNASDDIEGSDHNTDLYVEALVPLLADRPAIERLELVLGYRRSEYDSAGGVDAWKAENLGMEGASTDTDPAAALAVTAGTLRHRTFAAARCRGECRPRRQPRRLFGLVRLAGEDMRVCGGFHGTPLPDRLNRRAPGPRRPPFVTSGCPSLPHWPPALPARPPDAPEAPGRASS